MRHRPSCLTIAAAFALVTVLESGRPAVAGAQGSAPPVIRVVDSTKVQVIRTLNGSTLVGRVTAVVGDTVQFATSGGTLALARDQIREVREVNRTAIHNGAVWPDSPNPTRLFFAPTGRMLQKGEGYFSDTYLFFLNAAGGVTNRFTLGGGFSVFPTSNFGDNVFYATPKLGVVAGDNVNVAIGVLAGYAGLLDEGGRSFGIVYGVGTLGSPDAHLTAGAGFGYQGSDFASRPVFMLGGERRISRRVSLMTENYVISANDTEALFMYGFRFFGEKLSVDLAFANTTAVDEWVFPGIPYLAFALKF